MYEELFECVIGSFLMYIVFFYCSYYLVNGLLNYYNLVKRRIRFPGEGLAPVWRSPFILPVFPPMRFPLFLYQYFRFGFCLLSFPASPYFIIIFLQFLPWGSTLRPWDRQNRAKLIKEINQNAMTISVGVRVHCRFD